ncbi:MAG: hypothetical protein LRZ97_01340 [Candidatus Pacebacteria bacterium]|nr:hypothetical protein [Candidatus Paceibacterota bacterium]
MSNLNGSRVIYNLNDSKTYTLTVFNDNYRATCSTHITVAQHIITEYTPTGYVTLTGVPYTGAEDYIYLALLFVILLTVSFGIFFYRDKFWLLNLLTKRD